MAGLAQLLKIMISAFAGLPVFSSVNPGRHLDILANDVLLESVPERRRSLSACQQRTPMMWGERSILTNSVTCQAWLSIFVQLPTVLSGSCQHMKIRIGCHKPFEQG